MVVADRTWLGKRNTLEECSVYVNQDPRKITAIQYVRSHGAIYGEIDEKHPDDFESRNLLASIRKWVSLMKMQLHASLNSKMEISSGSLCQVWYF